MKTLTQFIESSGQRTIDAIHKKVDKHLESLTKHIESYKAGKMDADDLGHRAVKTAEKIAKVRGVDHNTAHQMVNAHFEKHLGESQIQEVSAAAMGRAAEFAHQHIPVRHPRHAGTAQNHVAQSHPAAHTPPKRSNFVVAHKTEHGWNASKHDTIHTAAKEYARHAGAGRHVKVVDHAGNIIHANHEAVVLDDATLDMIAEGATFIQDSYEKPFGHDQLMEALGR